MFTQLLFALILILIADFSFANYAAGCLKLLKSFKILKVSIFWETKQSFVSFNSSNPEL